MLRALEFAGGAVCSCGAVLVGGSAVVGGVVCCARARVAAVIAAKANADRFTVHLLALKRHVYTSLRSRLSEMTYMDA
jgi:hypothetical protein